MSNYRKKEEVIGHAHIWQSTTDLGAMKCDCGKWLISAEERNRRVEEWKSYFELVKTTPSYLDYQEMKMAWKTKDLDKIEQIRQRIKTRTRPVENEFGEMTIELNDPLSKPNFPNPESFPYIISN